MELTVKEFDLLVELLQNKNAALYREKLYEKVWGETYVGAGGWGMRLFHKICLSFVVIFGITFQASGYLLINFAQIYLDFVAGGEENDK